MIFRDDGGILFDGKMLSLDCRFRNICTANDNAPTTKWKKANKNKRKCFNKKFLGVNSTYNIFVALRKESALNSCLQHKQQRALLYIFFSL